MPKRFVYILRSLSHPERRYVGLTGDFDRRLGEHNAGLSPFTSRHRPWAMSVCIEFSDERRASAFERYLKTPSGRSFAKHHFAVGHDPDDDTLKTPSGRAFAKRHF